MGDRIQSGCAGVCTQSPAQVVPRAYRDMLRFGDLVAAATALAVLLAAGCTAPEESAPAEPPSSAAAEMSVPVSPTREAKMDTGQVTVTVPAGSVEQAGTLRATPGTAPRTVPGAAELGPAVSAELAGTELTGPGEVTFEVPKHWAQRELIPVAAWQQPDGSWRWIPTEVRQQGRLAVARTPHFSDGVLAGIDPGSFARDALGSIGRWVTGRAGAPPPTCAEEEAVREDVEVVSDSGDSVKWCLGREADRTVVKVTNNRLLYAQVSYPDEWENLTGPRVGVSLDRLLEPIATGIEQLAYQSAGRTVSLLRPGESMTIAVPDGATDRITVKGTPAAFFLQTLKTASEMMSTMRGFAGLPRGSASFDQMFALLGEGKGDNAAWAGAAYSCLESFTEQFTDDMTEPVTGPAQLQKVTAFAVECGAELGQADIVASGPLAWVTSAALATVIGVYSVASTLLTQLVGAGREIFDGVRSLTSDVDDAAYDVLVGSTGRVPETLTGDYYVHGGQVVVRANGTATASDYYCYIESSVLDERCAHRIEFEVEGISETQLRLTIIDEYNETSDGQRLPPRPSDNFSIPGDYFLIEAREPGFYLTSKYAADGTLREPADEANGLGNPWLCRPDLAEDDRLLSRCGA